MADNDAEWVASGRDKPDILVRKPELVVRQVRYPDALVNVFVLGCALLAVGLGGVVCARWFDHAWLQVSAAVVMTLGLFIITYSLFKGQALNDVV